MPSSRATIRNGIAEALETINGVNVYTNKVHDLSRWKLPAINVLTPAEKLDKYTEKLEHKYILDLVINIVDKHSDGSTLADNLDLLSNSVLSKVIRFVNQPSYINLLSIIPDSIEFSWEDGDKVYGSCIMTFKLIYKSDDGADSTELNPLEILTYRIDTNPEKPIEGVINYVD